MERLQKVIAARGYCSRRKAEALIQDGAVCVDGKQIKTLGTRVSPQAEIAIHNVLLQTHDPVYLLFHKPIRVLSACEDRSGRRCVTDFFSEIQQRVYPVGRLDYMTSGLLLLTNDGAFAHALLHPKNQMARVYRVRVQGIVDAAVYERLTKSIVLDGYQTKPADVSVQSIDRARHMTTLLMTVYEGRYHHIRQICSASGVEVIRLQRIRYGPFQLGHLATGKWRSLRPEEHALIK